MTGRRYKVFCSISGTKRDVLVHQAVEMDLEDVRSELVATLADDGDFVGLVDASGNTLQIMFEAEEELYWIDIPEPARVGSFGRRVKRAELEALLDALPAALSVDAVPGLEFTAW